MDKLSFFSDPLFTCYYFPPNNRHCVLFICKSQSQWFFTTLLVPELSGILSLCETLDTFPIAAGIENSLDHTELTQIDFIQCEIAFAPIFN